MKRILNLNDKKLVDYLNEYQPGSRIGLIFKHGVGDILMFLPYFDYLKSLYKDLTIHLLIIRDYEEQLYEKRDDLVRIDKDEKIYENYDYLFELKFREGTPQEVFLNKSFNFQKPELCCIEELGINPKNVGPSIVNIQNHKTKYIGFTFNRIGKYGAFNKLYNIPYELAKYMWLRTKQLGFIPIEIVFLHPDSINELDEVSKMYDFIDRTSRDLLPNFENVISIFSTLRGYATIDNGLFHIALNYFNHRNILYFDLIASLNFLTKFTDIQHFDFKHGEKFSDEKFTNWILSLGDSQ